MQAVIFGILGISELQRRNASPVHCCCASELKAKLAVDETAAKEVVKASTKLTLRTVLKKVAVIFGSCWSSYVDRLLMVATCLGTAAPTVTDVTQP
jgi:hypothetical protein